MYSGYFLDLGYAIINSYPNSFESSDNAHPDHEPKTDKCIKGFDGFTATVLNNSSGYAITKVDADKYTFTLGGTPTVTENAGGMTVTAGPVTQQA